MNADKRLELLKIAIEAWKSEGAEAVVKAARAMEEYIEGADAVEEYKRAVSEARAQKARTVWSQKRRTRQSKAIKDKWAQQKAAGLEGEGLKKLDLKVEPEPEPINVPEPPPKPEPTIVTISLPGLQSQYRTEPEAEPEAEIILPNEGTVEVYTAPTDEQPVFKDGPAPLYSIPLSPAKTERKPKEGRQQGAKRYQTQNDPRMEELISMLTTAGESGLPIGVIAQEVRITPKGSVYFCLQKLQREGRVTVDSDRIWYIVPESEQVSDADEVEDEKKRPSAGSQFAPRGGW